MPAGSSFGALPVVPPALRHTPSPSIWPWPFFFCRVLALKSPLAHARTQGRQEPLDNTPAPHCLHPGDRSGTSHTLLRVPAVGTKPLLPIATILVHTHLPLDFPLDSTGFALPCLSLSCFLGPPPCPKLTTCIQVLMSGLALGNPPLL